MSDEAREAAWKAYRTGPLFSPRGNSNHGASKRPFSAGFDAGVAEGIRQARAVAAPDFSQGSDYRRENYVREEIVAAIDALGDEDCAGDPGSIEVSPGGIGFIRTSASRLVSGWEGPKPKRRGWIEGKERDISRVD
jgi:hypothetical protein